MEKKPFGYIEELLASYDNSTGYNFIDERRLPDVKAIRGILDTLLEILFPGYSGTREITSENMMFVIGDLVCTVRYDLTKQVAMACRHNCQENRCDSNQCDIEAEEAVEQLLTKLPKIRQILKKDIAAAYAGDPAAVSEEEVVICYPGLKALAIHRLSHELYLTKVPLIPRMMNEIAHSQTGIDIHPGARIDEGLFIDHGTGVVIGETTVIGKQVKIYQGVTLGALSFPRDQKGNLLKGYKRHPTIEDDVTIYAHTTILGNVTIQKGSVIGSNVWLKENIDAHTVVTTEQQPVTKKRRRNVGDQD